MEMEQLVTELLDIIDAKKLNEKTIKQFTYEHISALYKTCIQLQGGMETYSALTKFIFNIPCKTYKNKLNMNKKLNVVFLVTDPNDWQYDDIYIKLLSSYYFNPAIAVVPYFKEGEDNLPKDYQDTLAYFKEKEKTIFGGYSNSVYSTVSEDETELYGWETVGIVPDVLLLVNSDVEGLRGDYYFKDLPLNVLCAYLPNLLTKQLDSVDNLCGYTQDEIFNNETTNIAWKVFTKEQEYLEKARVNSDIKGVNIVLLEAIEGETPDDAFLKELYKAIKFAK